jgi:hypothetical protein
LLDCMVHGFHGSLLMAAKIVPSIAQFLLG